MSMTKVLRNMNKVIIKNSPHILTATGCAGVISTAVLAAKSSPKAFDIIEKETRLRKKKNLPPLSYLDKVQMVWKCYIPAGVVGATTIGCIIGVNTVHAKRNAALASLYALSDTAFREYKSKVVDKIGAPAEMQIRDEVAKSQVAKQSFGRDVIITSGGDVLCMDSLSGRTFTSSYETIRQKVNDLNYRLRTEMRLPLNELYYELGLDGNDLGELVGFDIDKSQIDIHYSTQMTEDGRPCLVITPEIYSLE